MSKRIIVLCVLTIAFLSKILSVPAYPGLVTIQQPDGTSLRLYMRGDEHFHFYVSEDDYLLSLNDLGIFEYAEISKDLNINVLGVKAYNIKERGKKEINFLSKIEKISDQIVKLNVIRDHKLKQKKSSQIKKAPSFPNTGNPNGLIILVNFKDVKFVSNNPNKDFDEMMNTKGYSINGATGSAVDYFEASSFGKFHPNFVVLGPYDLPNDRAYYGKNVSGQDVNADSMIIHACNLADKDINFADFDEDGNKIIDNVFVYFAGHNEAEHGGEDCIWPHRGQVRGINSFDSVKLEVYACTSELKGSKGSKQCGIGTFCHEFSHVLQLPDMYVTDYSSNHKTVGIWDLMDQGPYNNEGRTPPTYSAYERFFVGWLKPEPLNKVQGLHKLPPLISSNKAYIFSKTDHNLDGMNPSPSEFFILENRQKIGLDSLAIHGEGLLVTRIDYNPHLWMDGENNPNKDKDDQGIQIMCAAGETDQPSRNTFPGSDNIPKCFLNFKKGSWEQPIENIHEYKDTIIFLFGEDDSTPIVSQLNVIDEFEEEVGNSQVKILSLKVKNIEGNVHLSFERSQHFKVRLHGDKSEPKFYADFMAASLSDTIDIDIVFTPQKFSYNKYFEDVLRISADGYNSIIKLKGKAKRTCKIQAPIALPASEITNESFTANWTEDKYATGYYLYVYNKVNSQSNDLEEFNYFGTPEFNKTGWSANFKTTNKKYISSAPFSVYFTSSKDTLYTKKYFLPVVEFDFWVRSDNSNGELFVDGLIDGEWKNILNKKYTSSMRNEILKCSIADTCYQFRIYIKTITADRRGLAFDDFNVHHQYSINFLCDREEVFDNYKVISGYNTKETYFYKVCSTDKESHDYEGRYEHVSPFSNEIKVEIESSKERQLKVTYDGSHYVVHLPLIFNSYKINIYTLTGTKVLSIVPTSTKVVLPNLPCNYYIIKYSEEGHMRRKDKFAKISYY